MCMMEKETNEEFDTIIMIIQIPYSCTAALIMPRTIDRILRISLLFIDYNFWLLVGIRVIERHIFDRFV